jgi:hypothetical protein
VDDGKVDGKEMKLGQRSIFKFLGSEVKFPPVETRSSKFWGQRSNFGFNSF